MRSNTWLNTFFKIIVIIMRNKDAGIICKNYHLGQYINLQGEIINVNIKKKRT
jgi:hypothetical protein